MRELQKGSATGSEKKSGLAIDFPTDGVCAENARKRICDPLFDRCQ
jgi:hypothetical protein